MSASAPGNFPWRWAGAVALVALSLRGLLWRIYQPIPYGDTGSYRRLAGSILNGFQRYDGTRTPGYPLFLALAGDDQGVWLAQMGLGLAITLLVFYLAWQVSGRAWFAAAAALAHTLNLSQLFFEANLLSETLTTFWVALTLAGVFIWLERPRRRSGLLAAALGVSASFAWLTRPLFIFLPFWVALFLAVGASTANPAADSLAGTSRMNWRATLAALLPAVAILAGWMGFINARFNTLGISTMTGYNLIQHTGHYFEYVPDRYAGLRDTYLKYRDEQIARTGTQTNTIWEAIPEMQRVTGMSFYQLSRTLATLSIDLIQEHPGLYLRNVAKGWWLFWRAPVYWTPEAFSEPALSRLAGALVLPQRLALVAVNLVFIASSLAGALSGWLRRLWRLSPALWFLAGTVWATSALQALLDHGDNPRFLVPLQSLVVLWAGWVALGSLEALRLRRGQAGAR